MIIKTRGIVLRSMKYSETSIIVDVYTEEKGLRSYIVSGVRTKNAKIKSGHLQLMSILDLVVYHRDDKDLTRTKEIKSAHVYQSIPFDVVKGAVGLFMTELAQKTIKEQEENPALFRFLFDSFVHLDSTPHPVANLHLHFLLELSVFLGFMPGEADNPETSYFDMQEGNFVEYEPIHAYFMSRELSDLVAQLLKSNREACHTIKMNKIERRQLLKHLLDFFKLHIDDFPTINAHLILEEVLD